VEWFESDKTEVVGRELYDIKSQGLEQINLSCKPEYSETEDKLAQLVTEYRGETLPLKASKRR
jgi:hypothetical protein